MAVTDTPATNKTFDVVVVGASLAGCTAAMLLARAGASVALVERQPDPAAFKRMCSHFIQGSAMPTIERVGLLDEILDAGGVRAGLRLWTAAGWILPTADNGVPRGVNIRRETLDPIVRGHAANTPGVELMQGLTAYELLFEGGRIAGVRLKHRQGDELSISARLVVGADGRASTIAELAGVRRRTVRHGRFVYGQYFRGPQPAGWPDQSAWFGDPQWAAAFPTDDGLTLYALMPTKDRLPEFKSDPTAAIIDYIADLPDAPPILDSVPVDHSLGKLDMTGIINEPVAPGLALIGDAAQAIDPLPGIGCGWAFQSAEWLADSVADALVSGRSLDSSLRAYRRRHRRALRQHAYLINDYSDGSPMRRPQRFVFNAAARDEQVAKQVFTIAARVGQPAPAMFKAFNRALVVNARHALRGGGVAGDPQTEVRERWLDPETRVLEAGPPDADEAVVFVHGNPGSADDWRLLLDAVGRDRRAVAVDLPDFGLSRASASFDHSVESYAEELSGTLRRLGVRKAHLVVHDFGGPVGLVWAASHPDETASLTLIDVGAMPGYRWHTMARIWRTPVVGELFQAITNRRGFRIGISHNEPRGLPRWFTDRMYDQYDRRTRRAVLRLYRSVDDPGAQFAEQLMGLVGTALPTLVIWGAEDAYLPSSYAQRQREFFPAADVHVLMASGHFPFVDAPETVERLLLTHLDRASDRAIDAVTVG